MHVFLLVEYFLPNLLYAILKKIRGISEGECSFRPARCIKCICTLQEPNHIFKVRVIAAKIIYDLQILGRLYTGFIHI